MSINSRTRRTQTNTQTTRGRQRFAAKVLAAIIALLVIPATLTISMRKAQTAPPEEQKEQICSKSDRISLPLNLSHLPKPPTPVPFLGMASATFGIIGGDTQWCWKRTCVHLPLTCERGDAIDVNGCSVKCCDVTGCSSATECPPREGEDE